MRFRPLAQEAPVARHAGTITIAGEVRSQLAAHIATACR
jgi:hypothetical protein